ncbi:MAG: TIGR02147 family protein [Fibrobacterota bacterium]
MKAIFCYNDYRIYLSDYYSQRKRRDSQYSLQRFATAIGFKSKSSIYSVLNGYRNLSKRAIVNISLALSHTQIESIYFETLVSFNQSNVGRERKYLALRLKMIANDSKNASLCLYSIKPYQYEYFSKWHHSVIRSLIDMYRFSGDYNWLANMVQPPISSQQARDSVALLINLGFIKKRKDGFFASTQKNIATEDKVISRTIRDYHATLIKIATHAIYNYPPEQRNVTAVCLGVSKDSYRLICEKTNDFHKEIMAIADTDQNANIVYQYTFQLFPLSDPNTASPIKMDVVDLFSS